MTDWRNGSHCMKTLIRKLHTRPTDSNYTDITFQLPDGSTVSAHKLILALASPFFEAQFYGLLAADPEENPTVEVKAVDSSAFRRVLDFIYMSGEVKWDIDSLEYWNLLQAAHMYLVPGLIDLCNNKLSDFLGKITDNKDLVDHVNRASELYIYEDILKSGLEEVKVRLDKIISTECWNQLQESVLLEILDDQKLKVSEGQLFLGIVEWCRANHSDNQAAILKFQTKFSSKVIVKNMSKDTFLRTIGDSEFISPGLFKSWTFEIMKNETVKSDATRFALFPLKVQQTVITRSNFLEQRVGGAGQPAPPTPPGPGEDLHEGELWRTYDEFEDVDIRFRIVQKVSEVHDVSPMRPRSKFGILLETQHHAKKGFDKSAIRERVSVKMVAKKEDGTVVKKLFKPIEDSVKESVNSRYNIFVLSKNKDERLHWHVMEVVVIIDRRPTCHIKGISGEKFAKTVSSGPQQNYLVEAESFHYDVNMSIKNAVEDIAEKLGVREDSNVLSQWLYIFTKGYVSNLRSRRAMPNDYWTAETVEDYMRCKVINFPIGVHNEAMRRDAFRSWIISQKLADEKEKDKKNVFVCTYNSYTQEVKFLKYHCLSVETKVETLGLLEHISLGRIEVTDEFFRQVTFGSAVTPSSRIFIRRIFPIQDENESGMRKYVVAEAIKGEFLTHIDDCHVLVIQENSGKGGSGATPVDFDKFLWSKIREVKVTFQLKVAETRPPTSGTDEQGSAPPAVVQHVAYLDPETTTSKHMLATISRLTDIAVDNLDIFKCYGGGNMVERPSEVPMDIRGDEQFSSMFEYNSKTRDRKLYYRPKVALHSAPTDSSPLEEGSQEKEPEEGSWPMEKTPVSKRK